MQTVLCSVLQSLVKCDNVVTSHVIKASMRQSHPPPTGSVKPPKRWLYFWLISISHLGLYLSTPIQ